MSEFEKKREELLATYHAIGTDVKVVPIAEYNQLVEQLDRTELAEAKARMELERWKDDYFKVLTYYQAENERLRTALKKIAYTPAFKSQAEIEAFADQVITNVRKALAGEST